MNKTKLLLTYIIVAVLFAACKKNDDLYSTLRVYFKNMYTTKSGIQLRIEANPDEFNIVNDQPVLTAYYAEVVGKFTYVYDTIVEHGHVWSQTNPNPTINPNDTTTYTRLGPWPTDSSGTFLSKISGLYPNTPLYVRSYVITSKGDTGYNPVVLVDTTLQIQNAWYYAGDIGTVGFDGAVVMSYGTGSNQRIVVGTGRAGQLLKQDMWEFDPNNETWSQFANYPFPVTQATGSAVYYTSPIYNAKIWKLYMGTGEINTSGTSKTNYWMQFDFGLGTWQPSTNYQFNVSRAIAFTIGSKIYVGFGITEDTISVTTFYVFDPAADDDTATYAWTQIPTLDDQYARGDAIAFTIQGIGFVGLGINTNTGEIFNDLWKFYPDEVTGGIWIRCADFPGLPRYGAVAFTIDNYGFVGLGWNGIQGYKDFYRYDPFLNQWYQAADYKVGPDFDPALDYQEVRDAIGFGVNSVGYVGTGYELRDTSTPYTKQVWKYIPW